MLVKGLYPYLKQVPLANDRTESSSNQKNKNTGAGFEVGYEVQATTVMEADATTVLNL